MIRRGKILSYDSRSGEGWALFVITPNLLEVEIRFDHHNLAEDFKYPQADDRVEGDIFIRIAPGTVKTRLVSKLKRLCSGGQAEWANSS